MDAEVCAVCGREKASCHVSPPWGLCDMNWPSSREEHWRLGYERMRIGGSDSSPCGPVLPDVDVCVGRPKR